MNTIILFANIFSLMVGAEVYFDFIYNFAFDFAYDVASSFPFNVDSGLSFDFGLGILDTLLVAMATLA